MTHIQTLTLGSYGTNCYIVWGDDSRRCVIIDPGYSPEQILAEVNRLGMTAEAILLTHGHFDHVGGVRQLAEATGCSVYLCEKELSLPTPFTAGPLYYTHLYGEGDVLSLAGLTITVLHTPGHTPGSVCLMTESSLFSGDTLFAGSCGRTDLPGGDWDTICASLRRLGMLEQNLSVYPGHGESTALDQEKRYNPYLKGVL